MFLDDSLSFSKGLVVKTEQPTAKEAMNLNSAKGDSQMTLITTGATTAAVETESLPGLERRRRRRKVTEGHDATTMTTTPGKTAKIAETPAAVPNNSIDQNEAEAHASTARPSCSYTTMIMEVFQASNKTRLDLPDIYGGVMAKYPYYRKANKVWQSSVRHALSQSKFFYKMERGPDEPGKGSLWVIDTRNTFTPNPPRKRKASTGGDYQSATACPVHSKDRHAVAPASKLVCTTTTVEPLEDERARGFHPSAASIPSPAASDDTDDINAVRRSGRARRPPRTKEADEYATTMAALPSHSRKPSLVMGTSLSTPPSSPMPQEHHHSETKMPASRVTSPPPSVARKRSSSIRSDKNLTGSGPFSSRTNPHFTIELPTYSPKKSSTSPRRTPSNLDLDLANIPGVVTSPRIRRPPQKLAEFVSSEDFKADPCGKRPALSSGSAFTSSFGANTDRTTTSSPVSSSTGSGSGVGEGAGMTERRVERRGRKRSRPDVVGCPSSSQQQQHTAGRRSNRKGMAVEDNAKSLIGLQGNTTLPVAMTTHCHAVVGGGAPAFISLKDLELSHAASLDNYDDEEDEHEEEEDYFGLHKRRNYRTSSSSRRYGSTGRQSQHETYEQRRQAGIQQIVVASLDWYEESDSEDDDVDVEVGVDVDGDSDLDMDNNNNNDNNSCNSSNVGVHGGTARSGFDSGFDSGSDSCKGFVRDGGWMMTETGNETTVGAAELARAGLEDIGGVTSVTDAFETVCMLAPEDEDQVVIDSAAAVGTVVDVDVATVPSHFMQPVEMPSGAGLMEQNGVHVHGSQAVSAAVDTSSLLLPVTIDTSSSLELVSLEAAAGVMPMIPGGILKELVAATTAVLEVSKSVAGSGVVAEPMEVEMEDEHSGDACVHIESMIAATVTTATATTTAELKADNYMGWLNL
ncbi:Forkhead box protein J3 [Linnemannia zychae]|nr:Forkhead box protein J3 [Linnemannia zychae]